jgi:hypothetical protein
VVGCSGDGKLIASLSRLSIMSLPSVPHWLGISERLLSQTLCDQLADFLLRSIYSWIVSRCGREHCSVGENIQPVLCSDREWTDIQGCW